jgi:hypothetical protein
MFLTWLVCGFFPLLIRCFTVPLTVCFLYILNFFSFRLKDTSIEVPGAILLVSFLLSNPSLGLAGLFLYLTFLCLLWFNSNYVLNFYQKRNAMYGIRFLMTRLYYLFLKWIALGLF